MFTVRFGPGLNPSTHTSALDNYLYPRFRQNTQCVMSVGTIGKKLGSDSPATDGLTDFPFGSECSEYRGGRAEAAVWIRVADLMSVRRRRRSSGFAAVYTLDVG